MTRFTQENLIRSLRQAVTPAFHAFMFNPLHLPQTWPFWVVASIVAILMPSFGGPLLRLIEGYVLTIFCLALAVPLPPPSKGDPSA